MKNKRILAVLGMAVVGALSLTAWVVLKAPEANGSWFSMEPTSEQMYAAGRGELPQTRMVTTSVSGPTSADFYAAGRGTFAEPVKVLAAAYEPTSMDFYAANGGVLD